MVFQQPNPFPMSIFENVAYALREEHGERGARRRKRRSRDELMPAVVDALRRAGLYEEVAGNLDHPALRLSGGQQQRLCIARALAAGPEVLLLDEPCSALDPISTATIEQLIIGLRLSVAIVIVTHNLQQAMRVADHVALHAPRRAGRVRAQLADLRPSPRSAHARVCERGVRVRYRAGDGHPRLGGKGRLSFWGWIWRARSGTSALGAVARGVWMTRRGRLGVPAVSRGIWRCHLGGRVLRLSEHAGTQRGTARQAKHEVLASQSTAVTKESPSMQVLQSTVIHSSSATAVVVALRNTSTHTLENAPIEVTVHDAHGSVLYQNNASGLEPSLSTVSLLLPGRETIWVDDQVTASGTPPDASALVGEGKTAGGGIPQLSVSGTHLSAEAGAEATLSGSVSNHSQLPSRTSSYTHSHAAPAR